MSQYPRSSSSYSRTGTSTIFYLTTLHPPSYYSPKNNLLFQQTNRTYTLNSTPMSPNKNNDIYNNHSKNIDFLSSNKKRSRASPFYNNEKSLRLQDEIDWINKIVTKKSKINKIMETNSTNYFNKNEEKELGNLLRNKNTFDHLYNIKNASYNSKYKKFNYVDLYSFNDDNSIPLIISTKYRKNGLFSKNDFDNYNHKIFMNEMIKFRNNGLNKWKKDFNNKFNEY